jgi:hypothetical protein
VPETDEIVYAITVSRAAQRRLCEAANITPVPEWRGEPFPEPELLQITRQLTGREFDDLVRPDEILRRAPYTCAVCGRTFTPADYRKARHAARRAGVLNSFLNGHPAHVACSDVL